MIKNKERYDLSQKNSLITGGGGLLGPEHGMALAKWGSQIILIDIDKKGLINAKNKILKKLKNCSIRTYIIDITKESDLTKLKTELENDGIQIDILINNAVLNPKMDSFNSQKSGMVEDYDMELWERELQVGITGSFLCCKVFGSQMAKNKNGVIINIASDLAIQAPDQRVYSKSGEIKDVKHFKPIGYPVVKSAMLGLNRYLATYWAHRGVRVNCLIPGAVNATQSKNLIKNISYRVPLGRLAKKFEYQEAIAFLASDSSSYMTGQELVMDGGRSIW